MANYQRVTAVGVLTLFAVELSRRTGPAAPPSTIVVDESSSQWDISQLEGKPSGSHVDPFSLEMIDPQMLPQIKNRADADKNLLLLAADSTRINVLLNSLVFAHVRAGLRNWVIFCLDAALGGFLESVGSACHLRLGKDWRKTGWFQELKDTDCPGQKGQVIHMDPGGCMDAVCHNFGRGDCIGYATNNRKECWGCYGDPQKEPVNIQHAPGVTLQYRRPRSSVWTLRWKAADELLSLGYNVLLLDLDAIVLQNPFPYLNTLDAGLAIQHGSQPAKAVKMWGSSFCMGISYWRAGGPVQREVHRSVLDMVLRSGDDQNAVVSALMVHDLRFTDSLDLNHQVPVNGTTDKGFQVSVLPFSMFPRVCEKAEPSHIVAHCFLKVKNAAGRSKKMSKRGMWGLRWDWQKQPVLPNEDDFLRSISQPPPTNDSK